ncbi:MULTISPECIES: DUF4142 domain-containing protein [Catenuloplanes]|uniref:Membrane protein n=1 Tax=Catenuloplanes niger TaxID=587534 RepID=A0AAE4CQ24_9ACTN|nr:DUF4142 domain-containing protein [Catenuloplanes niger]MDR7320037.1 putative membrane protein [Catenuloplanes niger]
MRITATTTAALLAGAVLTAGAPAAAASAEPAGTPGKVCAEDAKYLVRAHRGNLAEQAAGRAALAESDSEEVRHIAAMLIPDHARLDRAVRHLARDHGVALPPKPNQKQRDELAAVVAQDGAAFDAAWLAAQEKAHLQSLDFIARELDGGCAPEVREAAATAAPKVAAHLAMVRAALDPRA